jgi:glyoxylase-like metal-dependent hydrolase (beta-lactamase superfamily II)
MVIDAPGEVDKILLGLTDTSPRYIVITHNHHDHIAALNELTERLKVPVAMNPVDARKIGIVPDIELNDRAVIKLGQLTIRVRHTPGHTPGSISLFVDNYLFVGDTIFPGGPGKTANPAEFRQIIDTITTRILTLPDTTSIYPGHGLPTQVAKAKKELAVFNSRSHAPNLYGDVLWLSP